MWKEVTQNSRGRGGQRESTPAPHGFSRQRRDRAVNVVRGVGQMIVLSTDISTIFLSVLSAEGFPPLQHSALCLFPLVV